VSYLFNTFKTVDVLMLFKKITLFEWLSICFGVIKCLFLG